MYGAHLLFVIVKLLLFENHTDQDRTDETAGRIQTSLRIEILTSHQCEPGVLLMLEHTRDTGRRDLAVLLHLVHIHLPIHMDVDVLSNRHALDV